MAADEEDMGEKLKWADEQVEKRWKEFVKGGSFRNRPIYRVNIYGSRPHANTGRKLGRGGKGGGTSGGDNSFADS